MESFLTINKPGHKYDGCEVIPIGERGHPFLDSGYKMSEAIRAKVVRPVACLILSVGTWNEVMATFSAEELLVNVRIAPKHRR